MSPVKVTIPEKYTAFFDKFSDVGALFTKIIVEEAVPLIFPDADEELTQRVLHEGFSEAFCMSQDCYMFARVDGYSHEEALEIACVLLRGTIESVVPAMAEEQRHIHDESVARIERTLALLKQMDMANPRIKVLEDMLEAINKGKLITPEMLLTLMRTSSTPGKESC